MRFFYDDWSWIEFRRTGLHAMLASYDQHLVFAPIAAYQLLFATVGLAHYWPYRLLAVLAHLACATAVFAYARRRVGPAAVLLAAPIVFLGAGWEAVLQGFNTEITASLACGVAALLALDRGDRRGDVAACVLIGVVGLVGWRVWRRGARSPRLVALVVIVGTYWLLVAYSRPRSASPTPHDTCTREWCCSR
jgi:hypothetical protein